MFRYVSLLGRRQTVLNHQYFNPNPTQPNPTLQPLQMARLEAERQLRRKKVKEFKVKRQVTLHVPCMTNLTIHPILRAPCNNTPRKISGATKRWQVHAQPCYHARLLLHNICASTLTCAKTQLSVPPHAGPPWRYRLSANDRCE